MPTKMTLMEAADEITRLVQQANIPMVCQVANLQEEMRKVAQNGPGVSLRYGDAQVFSHECTLYIYLDLKCLSINWSGGYRNPTRARNCAKLFTDVATLACRIETFFESIELSNEH
jgi:hypothetical protein